MHWFPGPKHVDARSLLARTHARFAKTNTARYYPLMLHCTGDPRTAICTATATALLALIRWQDGDSDGPGDLAGLCKSCLLCRADGQATTCRGAGTLRHSTARIEGGTMDVQAGP